jgi:hypothetical protein
MLVGFEIELRLHQPAFGLKGASKLDKLVTIRHVTMNDYKKADSKMQLLQRWLLCQ